MDYIREELLRQQAALAALLQGGETKRAAKTMEREEPVLPFGETLAFPQNDGVRRMDIPAPADMPERALARARQAEMGGSLRRQRMGELPAAQGIRLRRDVWPEMEAGTLRKSGDGVPVSAAEADARCVSRAIQRDARRYDGGFSIY